MNQLFRGKNRASPAIGWLLLTPIFLFLIGCNGGASAPSTGRGSPAFAVAPEFAHFYAEQGGERVFGRPMTDIYFDEASERYIQYFERMRLEYDMDAAAPDGPIIISALGEWAFQGLGDRTIQPVEPSGPSQSRFFAETGFYLYDSFLTFYEANQGERLLGPPISPQFYEGTKLVQYFQNGRLEWEPESPVARRVQIGFLGRAHFYSSGAAFDHERRTRAQPVPHAGVTDVAVSAMVMSPILYADDDQIIFVEVLTRDGRPVQGIVVYLTIDYGDGTVETTILGESNERGQVQGVVPLPARQPGQEISVVAAALGAGGNIIGQTSLSFKTWW